MTANSLQTQTKKNPRVTLRKKLHKQTDYETNTVTSRAPRTRTRPSAHRPPLFVSFEIYFYILPFLTIFRTATSHRRLFLHHTYTPLVYIKPCRARTLQFKVITVPHTKVAYCAKRFSHTIPIFSLCGYRILL